VRMQPNGRVKGRLVGVSSSTNVLKGANAGCAPLVAAF
jgi:hypothetical protein